MAKGSGNRIILKNVRISYANLFEPRPVGEGDNAKMKYSTAVIVPYDHPQAESLKKKIDALGTSKFGDGWGAVKRKRNPLRDPWKEYEKARKEAEDEGDDPDEIPAPDESTRNCYVINCSSERKPQIVDRQLQPILDESEIYSGCYVNISVGGYAYDKEGNKGVGWGLNNVQLVKQGERLGGAPNAEEEFETMEEDDDGFSMD
jgi:hypothetical protein